MADPAPFYQDELVTLYCGDAREIAAWLTADVLVADPPYGISYRSGWGSAPCEPMAGDQDTSLRDEILRLWGSSKTAAVFGSWKQPWPPGVTTVLVWDKSDALGPGRGNLQSAWGCSFELVFLLGDWPRQPGQPRRASVLRSHRGLGSRYGLAAQLGHPTPKPLVLLTSLIEAAPPGLVADPFAGSGSTLLAARLLGRRSVGVELEERYCEIAAKRLAQSVLPLEDLAEVGL